MKGRRIQASDLGLDYLRSSKVRFMHDVDVMNMISEFARLKQSLVVQQVVACIGRWEWRPFCCLHDKRN